MKDIIKACLALVLVVVLAIGVFWEGDKKVPVKDKAQVVSKATENKVAVSDQMRIDVSNDGDEKAEMSVSLNGKEIKKADWAKDKVVYVAQAKEKDSKILVKSPNKVQGSLTLRGVAKKDKDGKRIAYWVRYKSIKIDGKEQLKEPQEVWHDKSYKITYDMEKGKEYKIDVVWEPK